MSRWLVTGAGGMLGQDLVTVLRHRGEQVTGLDRAELDVTDEGSIRAALRCGRPDVVVNCAAWTAVDDAEAQEDAALQVNGHGAANLATACAASGTRIVQLSTDYVFGTASGGTASGGTASGGTALSGTALSGTVLTGTGQRPFAEDDAPAPDTAYGRTKLAGELAVLRLLPLAGYVVRTAWLYGAHGPNFVRTMIRLAGERPTVDVVADQRGQPTWTVDVAEQIFTLVTSGAEPGVYHATSSGETSWFGLAREVYRLLGADQERVRPVTSASFPRPAPRPAYSVLRHARQAVAGIEPIGDWRRALQRAWPDLVA